MAYASPLRASRLMDALLPERQIRSPRQTGLIKSLLGSVTSDSSPIPRRQKGSSIGPDKDSLPNVGHVPACNDGSGSRVVAFGESP